MLTRPLVRAGRARDLDRLGNNGADEAADFGRRRVSWWIIDARRNSGVCARWRPVVLGLHRFLIALPGLLSTMMLVLLWILWYGLSEVPRRGVGLCMQYVMGLFCLGLLESGMENGVLLLCLVLLVHDDELWPYSVSMLVKWVAFLSTLHLPHGGTDLGFGGVSYVELLILYELWAGERLSLEKAHPRYLRPGRPISVSAVPFGPGNDIWRSCRFIGAMMRSLCTLLGGLGSVSALWNWGQSLQVEAYWVGEVWPWPYLQATGDVVCCLSQ